MEREGRSDTKFRRLLSGHRRCVNLKKRIVEGNIRLVFHVAKKYRDYGVPFEDLVQEGIIGLMRGVDRYDPDRGTEFSTLVVEWIEQCVQRAVVSYRHIVSLPARLLEKTSRILRVEAQLRQELEREPGFGEIAERAGLSEEEVKEMLIVQPPLSLDEPVGDDDFTLMDVLGYEDDPSRYVSTVPEVIKDFPEKERVVLELRYGLEDGIERTLEEVGQKLGVTKERIRQIELKGFERLKKRLRR
jgi:RNA polymerase primary sigma factor